MARTAPTILPAEPAAYPDGTQVRLSFVANLTVRDAGHGHKNLDCVFSDLVHTLGQFGITSQSEDGTLYLRTREGDHATLSITGAEASNGRH